MLSGHTQHSFTLSGRTQKVVCMWRLCALYSAMCLSLWQPSDASRHRCGSDLLNDLKFVCGDRGIYLGRGSWSGYGSRPRVSKGIVEQCCQSSGCDLHHLEMYCAKSKKPELPTTTTITTTSIPSSTTTTTTTTTSIPSSTTTTTTSIPSSTTTTTSIPSSTTTSSPTSTPTTTPTVALQFEAVFQRKLLEQLGAPNSQRRSHARRKTHSSPRRRKVLSASRKRAARQQHTSKSAIGSQQPKLS